MCDCVSMAAKRTNSSLDGWYTVKRKSSEKSSVELDCEDYSEDEVTEETPTVKRGVPVSIQILLQ